MVTLGAVREATNTAAVTAYLEERILPGSDWKLLKVRRRSVRLEPPDAYWAVYHVELGRGEPEIDEPTEDDSEPKARYPEQRELRLVARAAFRPEAWSAFTNIVAESYGLREGSPLDGLGLPVAFQETQHAFWFYPVDPSLPTLVEASDPRRMQRLFRARKNDILDYPARVSGVKIELARYVPQITAILRYELETTPSQAGKTLYGKVQRPGRGQRTDAIMQQLWRAFGRNRGALRIPRPRGYFPELAMFLEDAAEGTALDGDRVKPEFQAMAVHAAEALALMHESGVEAPQESHIEYELQRLDGVLDQFALVHPKAHFLLRELLIHIRNRLAKTPGEDWLPTHGDLKYDQFLHHDGAFTLIDFEYFTLAETSNDLGRFCSYLTPSMPKGWEQSVAAEEARTAFLDRYRELRPDATLARFPIYESVMLANRAMTAMWAQSRGWEAAVETLLVIAMERLNTRLR